MINKVFIQRSTITLYLLLLMITIGSVPFVSQAQKNPGPSEKGAFETGLYRNLFQEAGFSEEQIKEKIDEVVAMMFYGDDKQKIFYDYGSRGMGVQTSGPVPYIVTEGQSYGMLTCVLINKHKEFDKLWYFAKNYMQHQPKNPNFDKTKVGNFGWRIKPDGSEFDPWTAPDGEIWFVTALFMAADRWGNGQGIYNYSAEAQYILDNMRNKEATSDQTKIYDVFVPEDKPYHHYIRFGNFNSKYIDTSYYAPGFFKYWSKKASRDNKFWQDCASRAYDLYKSTCHPVTGLNPEYSNWDGTPYEHPNEPDRTMFGFEARRTNMHIAIDVMWWGKDAGDFAWAKNNTDKVHTFLYKQGVTTFFDQYNLDGTNPKGYHNSYTCTHVAFAGVAGTTDYIYDFVKELYNLGPYTGGGRWRYPGLMHYAFGILACSGNFRISNWVLDYAKPHADYIRNGSFESANLDNWTKESGNFLVENSFPHDGRYNLSIYGASELKQTIKGLSPNTTYKLSAYLKAGSSKTQVGIKVLGYGGKDLVQFTNKTDYTLCTIIFTTGKSKEKRSVK